MRNTYEDILRAKAILQNPLKDRIDDISKAYFNTNENLDKVLSITDIKDKDVLCVQASSDQLFKCLEKDAKTVDTFDINYLAKYFYYLKKNYLFRFKRLIPQELTKEEINEVLFSFSFRNEEEYEAFTFWNAILKEFSIDQILKLFYIYPEDNKFDLDKVSHRLKNFTLNYHSFNVFENIFYTDKQYDVVIVSNIMESTGILSKAHEQLRRITKTNGEIICSNVSTFDISEHSMHERAKMEEYFDYQTGLWEYDKCLEKDQQVAYKYIKR